jgi:hypothetical protein
VLPTLRYHRHLRLKDRCGAKAQQQRRRCCPLVAPNGRLGCKKSALIFRLLRTTARRKWTFQLNGDDCLPGKWLMRGITIDFGMVFG